MAPEETREARKRRLEEKFGPRFEVGVQRARERLHKQNQDADARQQPNPQIEPETQREESLFVREDTSPSANVRNENNKRSKVAFSVPKLGNSGREKNSSLDLIDWFSDAKTGSANKNEHNGAKKIAQESEGSPELGNIDGTPMSISSDEDRASSQEKIIP